VRRSRKRVLVVLGALCVTTTLVGVFNAKGLASRHENRKSASSEGEVATRGSEPDQSILQSRTTAPQARPRIVSVVDLRGVPIPGTAVAGVNGSSAVITAGDLRPLGLTDGGGRLALHDDKSRFILASKPGFIAIAVENGPGDVAIRMSDGHDLTLIVRNLVGAAVGGARVFASRAQLPPGLVDVPKTSVTIGARRGGYFETTTDENGTAVFSGLPPGKYLVAVRHPAMVQIDDPGDGGTVTVPSPRIDVRMAEPVVFALGCAPPRVIGWRYEFPKSARRNVRLARRCREIASRVESHFPGTICHVDVVPDEEGRVPVIPMDVLHTNGLRTTSVPGTLWSAFRVPTPESGVQSVPAPEVECRIEAKLPDGQLLDGFNGFSLAKMENGSSYNIPHSERQALEITGTMTLPAGRYRIMPVYPLDESDFEPIEFEVNETSRVVTIPLKQLLVGVKCQISREDGLEMDGYLLSIAVGERTLSFIAPATRLWIPLGGPATAVGSALGFKPIRTVLAPGSQDLVLSMRFETID
jgi:hypothetical protein